MHAVSIFMQIQKLWQIVKVFIACTQILDDIFVYTTRMQKNSSPTTLGAGVVRFSSI
jgi:hypothetical protein